MVNAAKIIRNLALTAAVLGLGALEFHHLALPPQSNSASQIQLIAASDRQILEDFSYKDGQAVLHHIKDDFGQTPILIHFWATWCNPCIAELPKLDHLAHDQGEHLKILPLSLDRDGLSKVENFFAEHTLTSLAALIPDAHTPLPEAVPATLLVDKNGKIAWNHLGAFDWDSPEVIQALDQLN